MLQAGRHDVNWETISVVVLADRLFVVGKQAAALLPSGQRPVFSHRLLVFSAFAGGNFLWSYSPTNVSEASEALVIRSALHGASDKRMKSVQVSHTLSSSPSERSATTSSLPPPESALMVLPSNKPRDVLGAAAASRSSSSPGGSQRQFLLIRVSHPSAPFAYDVAVITLKPSDGSSKGAELSMVITGLERRRPLLLTPAAVVACAAVNDDLLVVCCFTAEGEMRLFEFSCLTASWTPVVTSPLQFLKSPVVLRNGTTMHSLNLLDSKDDSSIVVLSISCDRLGVQVTLTSGGGQPANRKSLPSRSVTLPLVPPELAASTIIDSISTVEIADGVLLLYWTTHQGPVDPRGGHFACVFVSTEAPGGCTARVTPLVLVGVALPSPRAAPTMHVVARRAGGADIAFYGGEHLSRMSVPAGCVSLDEQRPSRVHDLFLLHIETIPHIAPVVVMSIPTCSHEVPAAASFLSPAPSTVAANDASFADRSSCESPISRGAPLSADQGTAVAGSGNNSISPARSCVPLHASLVETPSSVERRPAAPQKWPSRRQEEEGPRTPLRPPAHVPLFPADRPTAAQTDSDGQRAPSTERLVPSRRPATPTGKAAVAPPTATPPPQPPAPVRILSPKIGPVESTTVIDDKPSGVLQPPRNQAQTAAAAPSPAFQFGAVAASGFSDRAPQSAPFPLTNTLSNSTHELPVDPLIAQPRPSAITEEQEQGRALSDQPMHNSPVAAIARPVQVLLSQHHVVFVDQLCILMQRKLLMRNVLRRPHLSSSSSPNGNGSIVFMNAGDMLGVLWWLGLFHGSSRSSASFLFVDAVLDVVAAVFPNETNAIELLNRSLSCDDFKKVVHTLLAHPKHGQHARRVFDALQKSDTKVLVFDLLEWKLSTLPYNPDHFQFPVLRATESEEPNVRLLMHLCVDGPVAWQKALSSLSVPSQPFIGSSLSLRNILFSLVRSSQTLSQFMHRNGLSPSNHSLEEVIENAIALVVGEHHVPDANSQVDSSDRWSFETIVSRIRRGKHGDSLAAAEATRPFLCSGICEEEDKNEEIRDDPPFCLLEAAAVCCVIGRHLAASSSAAHRSPSTTMTLCERLITDLLRMLAATSSSEYASQAAATKDRMRRLSRPSSVIDQSSSSFTDPVASLAAPSGRSKSASLVPSGADGAIKRGISSLLHLPMPNPKLSDALRSRVAALISECVSNRIFACQAAVFARHSVSPISSPVTVAVPLNRGSAAGSSAASFAEEIVPRKIFVKLARVVIPRSAVPSRALDSWVDQALLCVAAAYPSIAFAIKSAGANPADAVPFWSSFLFLSTIFEAAGRVLAQRGDDAVGRCQALIETLTEQFLAYEEGRQPAVLKESFTFAARLVRDLLL